MVQPKFFESDKIPKWNRTLMKKMSAGELVAFIKRNPWYQTFDFGGGIIAKGTHPSEQQIDAVLPEKMDGVRYLDIGSNQGFQVLSAAMRGANAYGIDNKRRQIDVSNKLAWHFGIKAIFTLMDILEVDYRYNEYKRGFDYVTLMSVFHHFRKPFKSIQNVYHMTKPDGILIGEFCCWIEGERRWIKADRIPDEWGDLYHKAFPTIEAVAFFLKGFYSEVEVVSPLKMKHRIIMRAKK